MYLVSMLDKYKSRNTFAYFYDLQLLKAQLKEWAHQCYIDIISSGSIAKGTAVSLSSDVDYLISLTDTCENSNGGLKACYDSLYFYLTKNYQNIRKQNVSIRINLRGLEVDITPAKKQNGYQNYHSLYVSKSDTWTQTNIQKHITDISKSGRTNEIKLLKIWRELHKLDFPSIYLEYLLVDKILLNKSTDINNLNDNVWTVLKEFAKSESDNPLFSKITDPANSNNILSDLLTNSEKYRIIFQARDSIVKKDWGDIIW
ncbi:hypothetical protein MASR1M68_00190 [Elusimicrobiota bacterium]